jgi:hypothetical protein
MIRRWYFLLTISFVIVVLLSGCFGAPLPENFSGGAGAGAPKEEIEKAQQELKSVDSQELPPIKEEVRQLHLIMNNLTGWGQLGKYLDESGSGWNTVASYLAGENNIVDRVYNIIEKIDSDTLKQDLEAFALAFSKAYEEGDVDLLILAHRIVHDLDYWVFNYETVSGGSRNYWGATITLEGDKASAKAVFKME